MNSVSVQGSFSTHSQVKRQAIAIVCWKGSAGAVAAAAVGAVAAVVATLSCAKAGAVVAKDYVKIEVVVAVDVLSVAVYQIDNVFVAEAGECEEF